MDHEPTDPQYTEATQREIKAEIIKLASKPPDSPEIGRIRTHIDSLKASIEYLRDNIPTFLLSIDEFERSPLRLTNEERTHLTTLYDTLKQVAGLAARYLGIGLETYLIQVERERLLLRDLRELVLENITKGHLKYYSAPHGGWEKIEELNQQVDLEIQLMLGQIHRYEENRSLVGFRIERYYLVALIETLRLQHTLPTASEWAIRARDRVKDLDVICNFPIDINTITTIEFGFQILTQLNDTLQNLLGPTGLLSDMRNMHRHKQFQRLKTTLDQIDAPIRNFLSAFGKLAYPIQLQIDYLHSHFNLSATLSITATGVCVNCSLVLSEGLDSSLEAYCYIPTPGAIPVPLNIRSDKYFFVRRGYKLTLTESGNEILCSGVTKWPALTPYAVLGLYVGKKIKDVFVIRGTPNPISETEPEPGRPETTFRNPKKYRHRPR